jgi:hypothetical protein
MVGKKRVGKLLEIMHRKISANPNDAVEIASNVGSSDASSPPKRVKKSDVRTVGSLNRGASGENSEETQ